MAKLLLALDVATVTGFAWGRPGETPHADAIRFGRTGADDPEVWSKSLIWLTEQINVLRPDVVAIEAPIHTASAAGGSNAHTFVRLNGLQAVLRTVVELKMPVSAKLIHVQSARKLFIGHGNLPGAEAKARVKRRCIDLNWVTSEDATFD